MANKKSPSWLKYLIVAVVVAAAYFINVEVQTRLGQKVLDEMTLERHSFETALAKAQSENKQVLVTLSAIWCPTCRSLDKHIFSDPAVQAAIEAKYVFARVEYESPEGEAFQQRYNTRIFPTLLVLDPAGQVVTEIPVTTDPSEFISYL